MMICGICGKEEMVEVVEPYHYTECGLSNIVLEGIRVRKCACCGNTMPMIPALSGLHHAIARDVIKKQGNLEPSEIVFLRKFLGWSGVDFARNMHSTSSQVSKWESGKVRMSTPTELLLREMVARGKKIDDCHSYDINHEETTVMHRRFQHLREGWKSAA
nr:type II TA system antitoxin MqsA family protein [Geomonas sp. Red32]